VHQNIVNYLYRNLENVEKGRPNLKSWIVFCANAKNKGLCFFIDRGNSYEPELAISLNNN
jgi:hypothetical protein